VSTTHYDTLGVSVSEDKKAIDRAYRKLARELHPDINPSEAAQERLAGINDAYAVLSNTKRRAEYDQHVGVSAVATEAAPVSDNTRVAVVGDPSAARGPDIVVEATLNVAELSSGCERTVQVPFQRSCAACRGTGYDPAGALLSCATCSGLGMDAVTGATCPECRGRGTISQKLCGQCHGQKHSVQTYSVPIRVPAGARGGTELVQAGGGLPGTSVRGDLRVMVVVHLPDYFVQSAGGVGLVVPFHLSELLLGATVTIPTVTGTAELSVPPRTPDGHVVVLPAGGFPEPGGGTGPLHVRCELTPTTVTEATAAALEALLVAEKSVRDIRQHLS
jgi:molecular chaperone DnaJ